MPDSAILHTLVGRGRELGDGFIVRRTLPAAERRHVGPFVFFDHMGPVDLPPGVGLDVRPHPHIALATVTYLFAGEILHRDSLGSVQAIRPGDVNWMVAGRGIVHSERSSPETRRAGQHLHGLQAWVALPTTHEDCDPAFYHHPEASLPALERDGVHVRVIAGSAFGLRSPVAVASVTLYADIRLAAGASLEIPFESDGDTHDERAVYVVEGRVDCDRARDVGPATMLVLAPRTLVTVHAHEAARVMLIGGAAPDGERFIDWNFVASTRAKIDQAKADWRARRFPLVPGDELERIPLPGDRE